MSRRGARGSGTSRPAISGLLVETGCVGVLGLLFALLANALSPRGLPLAGHPPPPTVERAAPGVAASTISTSHGPGGNPASPPAQSLAARLAAQGLTLVRSNQVTELFRDPRREAELVVFLDARDAPQYEAGHIPGAYLLDPYRPERGLPAVLAASTAAEQVVVYCRGGECEDSGLAAGLLLSSGIPAAKLLVYDGGYAEWIANGLPTETGPRRSEP